MQDKVKSNYINAKVKMNTNETLCVLFSLQHSNLRISFTFTVIFFLYKFKSKRNSILHHMHTAFISICHPFPTQALSESIDPLKKQRTRRVCWRPSFPSNPLSHSLEVHNSILVRQNSGAAVVNQGTLLCDSPMWLNSPPTICLLTLAFSVRIIIKKLER